MRKILTSVRKFFAFYFSGFFSTLSRSGKLAGGISTLLGILVGYIRYRAGRDDVMKESAWQIPISAFLFFVVAMLFYVPFRKHEQLNETFARRRRRTAASIKRLRRRYRLEIKGLRTYVREQMDARAGAERNLKRALDQQTVTKAVLAETQSDVSALTSERDSLKSQLEELTKYKLFLLIDFERRPDPRDHWETVESTASVYLDHDVVNTFVLKAELIVLLENRGHDKVTIRKAWAQLLRMTSRGREKEIPLKRKLGLETHPLTMSPSTLDGYTVEPLTRGVPFILNWSCELSERIGERLDQNCFLRISMDAMNQDLFTVDLDVDWKARATDTAVRVTPRTSAQYCVQR